MGRLYGAESLVLTGVVAGPVGGVPAVRPRFSRQRADDLGYGLPMGRIDYLGKSVADLDVSIPGHPPIRCGFTYGVRFPGKRTGGRGMPFSGDEAEIVNADKDDDADILVLMPGEFDDSDEALVVIVNSRCLRKDRLIRELRHLTSSTPDSPSALVYVPEDRPGHVHQGHILQQRLDDEGICAEARSYYP